MRSLSIDRFRVHISDQGIQDLRYRLDATRMPERETVPDGSQGAQLSAVRQLTKYWGERYDWRRFEARLNGWDQFKTRLDGLDIHFLHARSRHEGALPIILTHGWPGSFVEFLDVMAPLTDPTRFGGTARDAFHVVIPSLPGFGFSDKPTSTGWGLPRIAAAWDELMRRLGYRRYVAQGGDFGAGVATWMGKQRPPGLAGIHLNLPMVFAPPPVVGAPTPAEQRALDQLAQYQATGAAYAALQSTRPQTLGYGLADSPTAQAAWIFEKIAAWSDSAGHPEKVLGYNRILDNISVYWFTDTSASSARLYAESFADDFVTIPLELPVAVSLFPRDLVSLPRIWSERVYRDLIYYNDAIARGGHFAAFEQPHLFVQELRAAFRRLR